MSDKFKVGDRVKVLGLIGTVFSADSIRVKVSHLNGDMEFFSDGRFFTHGEPCLELVERPKQKMKRTYYKVYWTDFGGDEIYESAYTKSVDEFKKQNPEYNEIIKIEEREFEIEE